MKLLSYHAGSITVDSADCNLLLYLQICPNNSLLSTSFIILEFDRVPWEAENLI